MGKYILGIESSCDDTSLGVVDDNGQTIFLKSYSQIEEHSPYGGVVPEIAARAHTERIIPLLEVLTNAYKPQDFRAVAAVCGPGLIGGVLVGATVGKALSLAWQKSFIAVNHLSAHAHSPAMAGECPYPYLLLLISGGHCQTIAVKGLDDYQIIGATRDDSAGEAFDKCAKILGLSYPGGPQIQFWAEKSLQRSIKLPIPMHHHDNCEFSFSGLKTALARMVGDTELDDNTRAEYAYAVEQAICQSLLSRTLKSIEFYKNNISPTVRLAVAGGVAANKTMRQILCNLAPNHVDQVVLTPLPYCTDNGAMVAFYGYLKAQAGQFDGLEFPIRPRWNLGATE